jgi:hypothetical protein
MNENVSPDFETQELHRLLADQEQIKSNRVPGVKTVLVVLSSRGATLDVSALKLKVLLTYPEAVVFFKMTSGRAIGMASPDHVDLLIDLTGPRQRQGWFYSRKLRAMARVAVGRNAGLFRKKIYDRVFDEKAKMRELPSDLMHRERRVQREVLALAGVSVAQHGDPMPDLGKEIALDLPKLRKA